MLVSIEKKKNWANKAKKNVILNNNLQIITLTGISSARALSKVLLGWSPQVKK